MISEIQEWMQKKKTILEPQERLQPPTNNTDVEQPEPRRSSQGQLLNTGRQRPMEDEYQYSQGVFDPDDDGFQPPEKICKIATQSEYYNYVNALDFIEENRKAIYGTLNAAILSYTKLVGHLGDWGFETNPYEPCCWNMYMDNKQFTIMFHVDDM